MGNDSRGTASMTYLEWRAECELVDRKELTEWQEYCQTLAAEDEDI